MLTYEDIMAKHDKVKSVGFTGTTEDYAKKFKPGSRTVIFRYGKIPGYRADRTSTGRWSYYSWGFAISDPSATWAWYGHYTCSRRSAKKLYAELKQAAKERGFRVVLIVDPISGLDKDLNHVKQKRDK